MATDHSTTTHEDRVAFVLRRANKPYDAAVTCIREARAVADLLALASDADRASIETASLMVYGLLQSAEKHLDALWVAIGGKSVADADSNGESPVDASRAEVQS